jgi:hypothetical protein
MVTVSLDSPSCEVTLLILCSVVYRNVTRQAKGLYRLNHVGALRTGLAYLSLYNSGWFCHTQTPPPPPEEPLAGGLHQTSGTSSSGRKGTPVTQWKWGWRDFE